MDTLDDMTTKYSAAKLSIAGADTERETLFESLVFPPTLPVILVYASETALRDEILLLWKS